MMAIIMLQEHYLLKDINPKSEKDKWVFNNIFHIYWIYLINKIKSKEVEKNIKTVYYSYPNIIRI